MAWKNAVAASYKVEKLVPKLKIVVRHRPIRLSQPQGPYGRLIKLRKTVTALFKHERIELYFPRASEARGYAERLITEAIRHGDCHLPTMELADFWLEEKQLIHKLFKVLVPRYKIYDTAYTNIYNLPMPTEGRHVQRVVMELKGNPFPPVLQRQLSTKLQIHNILLHEAKKELYGESSSSDTDETQWKYINQSEHELKNNFQKLNLNSTPDVKEAK